MPRRPLTLLAAAALVAACLVPGAAAQGATTTQPATSAGPTTSSSTDVVGAGGVVSLPPSRILDTRAPSQASVSPYEARAVDVLGRGGIPVADVSAVVLNVTVLSWEAGGYLTAYPDGTTRPTASNVNFGPRAVVPNAVVVKVGTNGKVALFNGSASSVHVLVDVAGYVVGGAATAAGAVSALPPARVLDTRTSAPVAAFGTHTLQVAGRGGVPATGVAAVVLNLTAVAPTRPGYVTAHPSGTTRPTASNLNFAAGQVVPDLVVVRLGTDGKVALFNGSPGSTHLLADVAGYVVGGGATAPGALAAVAPARLLDTRTTTAVPAYGTTTVQVRGRGGVPADGVGSVVLNVTAVTPGRGGYLTAFPSGTPRPDSSNVNFVAGQVVPNLVVVELGDDGRVALFNGSAGSTHLLVDVAGFVLPGRGVGSYVPTALPGAGGFAQLACAAADDCVAARWGVGDPGPATALAIGATTSAEVVVPLPPDADRDAGSDVTGAACSTDGTCVLSGYYAQVDGDLATFAATRADGTWSAQRLIDPGPDEFPLGELVDCAPAGGCVVVSQLVQGDAVVTVAHRLVTGTWQPMALPAPSYASGDVQVQDLSCPSADSCTAVGRYRTREDRERLATWVMDGTGWRATHVEIASAGPDTYLEALVDCSGPSRCATALSFDAGSFWYGFSDGGTPWQLRYEHGPEVMPTGVSCEPSGTCTAVGTMFSPDYSVTYPMVRRLTGTAWATEYLPAETAFLSGVDCTDATSCTAIGDEGGPVVLTRSGAGWTRAEVPGQVEWLDQVSCQAPGTCTVVGTSGDPEAGTERGWLIR